MLNRKNLLFFVLLIFVSSCRSDSEPSRADQSGYNNNVRLANTSYGLTKADLAWHATNTYGLNCFEVISVGSMTPDGYYFIDCSSGNRLRVYPRPDKHPKITNVNGGYN